MKHLLAITTTCVLLCLATPPVWADGAGIEWDVLNDEVLELLRAGKYDRGVVVAKKALEVAEQNVQRLAGLEGVQKVRLQSCRCVR